MIKINEFLDVLEYLIDRLSGHSILINSRHKQGLLTSVIDIPQFQVFAKNIHDVPMEYMHILHTNRRRL